ncbi:putative NF-X1 finger and helicase domain protein [Macrophomina phaseolina]|uniref:NF-X1 finger and helicase domain protein n=1 Tax=Macrophomina phaseolina TaxID=35725 RepID=A0ABQ8FVA4_9PEZI|nr:putative NF-X1 finger and helicase domain protein [Macrophomina phaseolina]
MEKRRACRYVTRSEGCRFGETCKFSHDLQNSLSNHPVSTSEADFRKWRFQIPKNASELVAIDPEIRQAVISELASDGGLMCIKELADQDLGTVPEKLKVRRFMSQYLPFFQTLAHPDVMSSVILEQPLGDIFTSLYGLSGQRAIRIFSFTAEILINLLGDCNAISHSLPNVFEAVFLVFSRIIDVNGGAQINPGIPSIVETFSEALEQVILTHDDSAFQLSHTHLARIQRRLGIGEAIPELTKMPAVPATKASFALIQDHPGSLSQKGPRHDNDCSDIRDISILPTWQEIQSLRSEYLPVKDSAEWHRPGIQGLLDRHFRLLREDTIGQLRDVIQIELRKIQQDGTYVDVRQESRQLIRTYTYRGVSITNFCVNRRDGLQFEVCFMQPQQVRGLNKVSRQEWWVNSRRLQPDALVCLVDQRGLLLFCSVCDSSKKSQQRETQEGDSNVMSEQPRNLHADAERAFLTLRLVECNDQSTSALLRRFPTTDQLSLVEFPGVLLPSFQPTLKALQRMSETEDVPFPEFLAPSNKNTNGIFHVPPPAYSRKSGFRYNLRTIMSDNSDLHLSTQHPFEMNALQEGSSLDESQSRAIVDALTRSLALIQGPPGTGKSYTGIMLIKVLLDNRTSANLGPILCVCYTNHALDQLLEHLVNSGVKQIIRVGSRSKSETLQPLNLRLVAQKMERTKTERHQAWQIGKRLSDDENEIQGLITLLRNADSWMSVKEYLQDYFPHHHDQLYGIDEEGWIRVDYHPGQIMHNWLLGDVNVYAWQQPRPLEILQESDLNGMTNQERNMLYRYWTKQARNNIRSSLITAFGEYHERKSLHERNRMELDLRCLQQAHVIGITTSGLARNLELLRRIRTKVMICEEAGEVLESHTLTAMLPSVEHAILIGDHLQLRPQIQRYDLGREHPRGVQYSLDVSLFERLVQPSDTSAVKLPFTTLETQRRMHPLISQLVRDTLYPALKDAPSTTIYPEVPGMRQRLFWFEHSEFEANGHDTQAAISTSHSNDFETEMAVGLVSHLMRQGIYHANDIAVITPYLGQLQRLRKRLGKMCELVLNDRDLDELEQAGLTADETPQTNKASVLTALKVATIDNFQGEEAKVVIISLVRSNKRNNCGFLKTAQHGMYIIGNSQTAGGIQMWADVIGILQDGGHIGSHFELQCPRHPDKPIRVHRPDDFVQSSPEGGCNQQCEQRLRCGHACINRCHSSMLHDAVVCLVSCPRSLNGCDHSCPRACGEPCPEKCTVNVHDPSRTLSCGHKKTDLPCWRAQDLPTVVCKVKVGRIVPGCGHKVELPCHVNHTADDFDCTAVCDAILQCGHTCKQRCTSCRRKSDGIITIADHGICQQICGRNYNTCRHSCTATCHGEKPCPLCSAPCEVFCSHSRCDKKCNEPCTPCAQPTCPSRCPHSQCTLPCAAPCDWLPCSKRCEEILSCGHNCPSLCGEQCPDVRFCQICATDEVKDIQVDYIEMLTYKEVDLDQDPCIFPSCGHIMTLANMDGHMDMEKHYDTSPDGNLRGIRPAPPFSNDELKTCPTCRGSFRNIARYGRIVRRAHLDESTKKFIIWSHKEYLGLHGDFQKQHEQLVNTAGDIQIELTVPLKLQISGRASHQFNLIKQAVGSLLLTSRYKPIFQLRNRIQTYVNKVQKEEQPFKRVWDFCEDARRRRNAKSSFDFNNEVLQTKAHLMAMALLIRCDSAILSDFLSIWNDKVPSSLRAESAIDFTCHRECCQELLKEAIHSNNPLQAVEAHVFYAQYNAMEHSVVCPESKEQLREQGVYHIEAAKTLCAKNPGSTSGMMEEVEAVEKMLRASTFYSVVTSEERRNVLAAMATEFRGTGHWYYCGNGHPFTVGECGMPMEETRCPQCGEPAGGRSHQPAAGVHRAEDLEIELHNLRL